MLRYGVRLEEAQRGGHLPIGINHIPEHTLSQTFQKPTSSNTPPRILMAFDIVVIVSSHLAPAPLLKCYSSLPFPSLPTHL